MLNEDLTLVHGFPNWLSKVVDWKDSKQICKWLSRPANRTKSLLLVAGFAVESPAEAKKRRTQGFGHRPSHRSSSGGSSR